MGTSTVSGPFRSQNGFQELVNGVWTPVGGGGGGGGGIDYTPFTWNIGGNTEIVLPTPTTAGQAWRYVSNLAGWTPGTSLEISFSTPATNLGLGAINVFGDQYGYVVYNDEIINNFFQFEVVYVDTFTSDEFGVFSLYTLDGIAL